MQTHWLHRNGSDSVILFFCGWGTDYRPLTDIPHGGTDVLCLYAYHTGCAPDWDALLAPYSERHIIAWSMGVLQAELALAQRAAEFGSALAVNGSLRPVDDRFGIPCRAYQLTIDSFSDSALRKFIQRMCKDRQSISRYNERLPQRELAEQKSELIFHQQQTEQLGADTSVLFTKALVGKADLIFPPDNLRSFWHGKVPITESDMPHFVFYHFPTWADMLTV